jgi:sulfoxide reductase heme-binding subunit YedZ
VLNIFLLPLAILTSYIFLDDEIINKTSYVITSTGYIALVYLVITLSLPLFNSNSLKIKTKLFGISAFYFSMIHFILYVIDNSYDLALIIEDALFRNYIIVGYLALILLVPMYLTSFKYFKDKIKEWKKLHKIIYMVYFFILTHIYFIIKADYYYLILFSSIFLVIIIFKRYNISKINE